jgi:putative membrane protein
MKPVVVLSFLLTSATAFAPLTRERASLRRLTEPTETALGPLTKGKIIDPLSVNEEARKLRRDFFTHESWLKHRSKDRFLATITKLLFESRVVRALIEELIFGR